MSRQHYKRGFKGHTSAYLQEYELHAIDADMRPTPCHPRWRGRAWLSTSRFRSSWEVGRPGRVVVELLDESGGVHVPEKRLIPGLAGPSKVTLD